MKSSYPTALYTAAATASILVFPCVEIYLNNRNQFTLTGWSAAGFALSGWCIAALPVFLLLAAAGKARVFPAANSLVLAGGITFLLQYLCWSGFFPEVAYDDTPAGDMIVLAMFHLLFLALPLVPALLFRRWIHHHTGEIAAVIILTQAVAVFGPLAGSNAQAYDFHEYAVSEETKFCFARGENVIVLVVDAMGEDLCKEVMTRYPEVKTLFRDFTCFDRMTSPLPKTMYAVPAILTGVEFDNSDDHARYLNQACRSENSLFRALKEAGYRTEGYPFILQTISFNPEVIDNSIPITGRVKKQSVIKIVDAALNRQLPFFLKPLLEEYYYLATDHFVTPRDPEAGVPSSEPFDITFYRRLGREFKVDPHEKGFKYLHIHGAHAPVRTDENLEPSQETLKVKQLRGSLKIVERLIAELKKAGLYDNATLVITGDHTENYTPEVAAFIKRKNERREELAYNSTPCKVSDIAGTVLQSCLPGSGAASLFDRPPVIGDGSRRDAAPSPVLLFSEWQPAGEARKLDDFDLHHQSFALDNRRMIMESPFDTVPVKVALIARNLTSGDCLESIAFPGEASCRYFQSPKIDFPDGEYQIFLAGEAVLLSLPKFLVIKNGLCRFETEYPNTGPRPMDPGEEITFLPMAAYPQLILPDGRQLHRDTLVLPENLRLGVRLPASPEPMTLTLTLKCQAMNPGALFIRNGSGEAAQIAVKDQSPITVKLPIPANSGPEIADLCFDFQSRLRNRDESSQPLRLQIEKIRLDL